MGSCSSSADYRASLTSKRGRKPLDRCQVVQNESRPLPSGIPHRFAPGVDHEFFPFLRLTASRISYRLLRASAERIKSTKSSVTVLSRFRLTGCSSPFSVLSPARAGELRSGPNGRESQRSNPPTEPRGASVPGLPRFPISVSPFRASEPLLSVLQSGYL